MKTILRNSRRALETGHGHLRPKADLAKLVRSVQTQTRARYSRIRLEPVSEITACQCHLVGKKLWEIFPQAGQEKR